ncbi:hypothetical protein P43SY_009139 [Pythium insidiosum]|uniref:WW domain-containing protein n=1 Tax=Pythium insidiosum TaxID=114742 RepID=A0AAD5LJ46_PYTIN|nr:hypothetical protein P43SY_009139 [Pythium insidiosum]
MRRGGSGPGGSLPSSSALSVADPADYDAHRSGSSSSLGGSTAAVATDINAAIAKLGIRSRSALGLGSRTPSDRSVSGPHAGITPRNSSHRATDPTTVSMSSSRSSSSSSPVSLSQRGLEIDEMLLADLTPARRQQLIEFIDRSVDDAYNLCHGFGRLQWQPAKARESVTIYRPKVDDDTRLDATVRSKCNIPATFDELLDTLITETTADFVEHESAVNPTEFLDGQVLYTLVPRTPTDRFVCIKWHCVKSLAPSVAKHRDYIYLEIVDQFTDREGKKVGFRLSKSVELEELASFDTSALFVRGRTLTLQSFSEIAPNSVEFHTMMINDLGERLPTWLVHKIVDTAAMRVACLRDYINQRRMDLLAHLDRMTMISASLKNLHQPAVPTMEAQVATITEIEARAQEEAALAADFLQAMEAANNGSATLAAATAVAAVASKASASRTSFASRSSLMLTPLDVRDPRRRRFVTEPVTPVADIHLLREDGSFSSFLSDSSFTAIADVPEGVVAGWIAVHSKTTGKVYYYNESCGTTSWTLPTPDTHRKNAPYMVL